MRTVTEQRLRSVVPVGEAHYDVVLPAGTVTAAWNAWALNWPLIPDGVFAAIQFDTSEDQGQTWQPRLRIEYVGGADSRTGARTRGPHPSWSVDPPLARALRGRWRFSAVQPLDCAVEMTLTVGEP